MRCRESSVVQSAAMEVVHQLLAMVAVLLLMEVWDLALQPGRQVVQAELPRGLVQDQRHQHGEGQVPRLPPGVVRPVLGHGLQPGEDQVLEDLPRAVELLHGVRVGMAVVRLREGTIQQEHPVLHNGTILPKSQHPVYGMRRLQGYPSQFNQI